MRTALLYQLYHAVGQMNAPDGRPTNAVFGFARDLFYFRDELKPDYLVYVFDPPGPTFRDKIAGDYKAHRKPPDDDLIAQVPLIHQLLAAANVPVLTFLGYEADDVIATVAKAGAACGFDVLICSSDKDCRQLVDDRIRILNLRKQVFLDCQAIVADWGVTPEQAIDYQTLVGDTVDNVKGVKGVGGKTAAKLLQKFGSIDNLLKNLDQLDGVVSAKIQAAIKEAADSNALATGRKLVTLDTNTPVSLEWEKWHRPEWDTAKMLALFQEWGFRSFANRVRGLAATVSTKSPEPAAPAATQADLFAGMEPGEFNFGANAAGDDWHGDYKLVDTPAKFESFLKELKRERRFAVDLETTGLEPVTCDLVGLAFCWKAGQGYYLTVRGPAGEPRLDEAAVLKELKPLLEDPTIFKINQNIKYDRNVFRALGIRLQGVAGDSMVADYLLRSGERSHSLDDLALRYFQHQNISIEELIGKPGKNQITMDRVPAAKIASYAGEDADVAFRLCELLESKLEQVGLRQLYDEVEIPLIDVLAEMEFTGIRLDVPLLKRLSEEMAQQLVGIEARSFAWRAASLTSPRPNRWARSSSRN